ncbi:RdgB/HAM1 family non-canonical purine NTP pyrophosphatase [Reinekea thalattae]|uniref:dITP/XTP pyrophosphatase n=1 Tax=Reinekea thalattae TaxID=2593301 RepID=A0A5C8YZZ0_9GAMM|nr:RdgB/HAM1 family non-canonical purine NTP pyrophosphatase [Reinekea thalattae]TXR51435.1 RdgB/HAM1 family non-canonical purine NTP pyrophosphatase [Reinekea thalattae]
MYCQRQWVLASNNAGKLKEFNELLAPMNIEIKAQREFGVEDAVEDGLSFIENAIIKARHAAKATGLPALSDDSGLEVDFLKGAPGIYSARYSQMNGGEAGDLANLNLVLEQMKGVAPEQRIARFHCVLAFVRHELDPTPIIIQGTWQGTLLEAARGENGFGYDPIFWVESEQCSSAELSKERKNQLSHRGQAVRQFKAKMETLL